MKGGAGVIKGVTVVMESGVVVVEGWHSWYWDYADYSQLELRDWRDTIYLKGGNFGRL